MQHFFRKGIEQMNFIFRSPYFPKVYWQFCDRLRKNGVNVLCIGDCPYDELSPELKGAMTEYYRVDTMEDYDHVYKAVAFFAFKYGRIDWIESNNEYWLEQDARIRSDFNISTGVRLEDLDSWKHKSAMKAYYAKAEIPTARCHKVTDIAAAREFLKEIGGYPVIVKPDVGVGASDTWRLDNDGDLERFYGDLPEHPYVMEEFVFGNIYSYDAIADSNGDPLFESATWFPPSIADIVGGGDLAYYVMPEVPKQLAERGRRTIKAFNVKSRFVHFEFFRLDKARPNLGEAGDFVGLEVNMRPAGGYSTDMMNFAHSTDVYQIYADMVTADKRLLPESGDDHYCVYASQKDGHSYLHDDGEIRSKFAGRIVMAERMPDILAGAMGNSMYTAHAYSEDEAREFIEFVHAR